ncbi:MAG: hypothetical protein GY862_10745 [Gammaproteobacteria bacterium]|nr:hypothetical protein [Gammaproteobacteria bacterium]
MMEAAATAQNILLFIDLDDTVFQTRNKNKHGILPATRAAKAANVSYMTQYQHLFFELFRQSKQVLIIPVTARDLRQYHNTFLSEDEQISTAVLYFSGMILHNGKKDEQWDIRIKNAYAGLKTPISLMQDRVNSTVGGETAFTIYNVDGYYLTVKASRDCPDDVRKNCFTQLEALVTDEYFIHTNARAFSLLPEFLDKRHAVAYLIEKYRPDLTIGAGDSITDLPFMRECDFRIFPKYTQISEQFSAARKTKPGSLSDLSR